MSLRWLGALLDAGIEVHGQVVVCPGVNGGAVLEDTLCTVLEEYSALHSVCVVPLGVSKHHHEPRLREHTRDEAGQVIDTVEHWQEVFLAQTGRRLVHAADEYYLMADRGFPEPDTYEGFAMHEDGVGIVATFQAEFTGLVDEATGAASGFFAWVDGAPPEGYRAPRTTPDGSTAVALRPRSNAPVGILTGHYGAQVLQPLVAGLDRNDVRVLPVQNDFFGGNVAVAGLMVGEDIARVLADQPQGHRYLLPDICLSRGLFLDGTSPQDLPRPVEIVATDGIALRDTLTLGSAPL